MRFWRAAAPADVVIDLRERLAPYDRPEEGDAPVHATAGLAPQGHEPDGRERGRSDEPYRPRHMAARNGRPLRAGSA